MAFKLSDKTKKKGQFLLKTYSDDGTKTQGTKYDRARAVLGTDKVFDAEKTYEITNQSGQVLGTVSHDAKKAIENNKLDSYKPKNDEEKRVIDSLVGESQNKKEKKTNNNSVFKRYNINPDKFEFSDFLNWADEHNYKTKDLNAPNAVNYSPTNYSITPKYEGGFLGFGGKKMTTEQEDKDMEFLRKFVTKKTDNPSNKVIDATLYTAKELVKNPVKTGSYLINKASSGATGVLENSIKLVETVPDLAFSKVARLVGADKLAESLEKNVGDVWERETYAERQSREADDLINDKNIQFVGNIVENAGALVPAIATEVATAGMSPALDTQITSLVGGKTFKALNKVSNTKAGKILSNMLKPSQLVFQSGVFGSSASNAYRETKDVDKAMAYGAITAVAEGLTEQLFGGFAGTDMGSSLIDFPITNNTARKVVNLFTEGAEEIIMSYGDTGIKRITGVDKNAALPTAKEVIESGVSGVLLSGLMSAATYPINKGQTKRLVNSLNIVTNALNAEISDEKLKFIPLNQNASEKEIITRQGEIENFAKTYADALGVLLINDETGTVSTSNVGKKLGSLKEEVIKTGLESPKESEAYKNAKTLSKKKNVSDYDLGKQYLLNVEQVSQETTEVKTKFAPGGATENVINLEKMLANEGVAEKDIEKIVSDAVTLESSLAKTPTTNMTAEMVERANGTITTQAKNNLAMNGAKNADYWGIYGTNLKILSKNDKMIDEGFIDTYADAYAEGLKEGNSISYHSLAKNTDNVAKTLKSYVLTGAVPESMRGTNIVEKAGENLKGIIQSAVGSLSSAHKIIYGEGANIAKQAEAIKNGDFSSVVSKANNNTTPSFNNAINIDEIRMVMNSTFKEGAMERIAEIMDAKTGKVDMGLFAYKLAKYYQKNGNIGPFREFFADGGIAVAKTLEDMTTKTKTTSAKEKTAPPKISILDMEEVENKTTTEETTKEAENETGEVEKSAEGKKEKAKTESKKDKEIKESVPEKEEEKAKDNSGKALKRLGQKGKAAYQKVLEIEQSMHSEMSEYEVLREFEKSYRAGREGVKNTDGSRLTEQSRKVAEKAGKADRKSETKKKPKYSVAEGASESQTKKTNDAEYMDAVENGDLETAQKMVDEEAKRKGYNSPKLYHGTNSFGFTEFDLSKMDDKRTIFLTNNKRIASTYSGVSGERKISDVYNKDIEKLDAENIAKELNKFVKDYYKDTFEFADYNYSYYNLKKLNDLINVVNDGLVELTSEVEQKIAEYANKIAFDSDDVNTKIYKQLVSLKERLDKWDYNNLSTPIYLLIHHTDVFADNSAKYGELEANIRLMNDLRKNENISDGVVVEESLGRYSIEVMSKDDAVSKLKDLEQKGNYALYAKMSKPLIIDGRAQNWNNIRRWSDGLISDKKTFELADDDEFYYLKNKETGQIIKEASVDILKTSKMSSSETIDFLINKNRNILAIKYENVKTTREIAKVAKDMGYDSVVIKNITDNGGRNYNVGMEETADIYILFDSNNVKSADPITYDEKGNVIPLSERFDKNNMDIRYSIDSNFITEYDKWVEDGRPYRKNITVGRTSEALKSIGVKEQKIVWDTSKINESLTKHQYLNDTILKQIPNLIESPVIVMQSKKSNSRITMFGEVYDNDGLPVMAVLELQPKNRAQTLILDEIKVVSTHSRKTNDVKSMAQTQNLINSSEILYVEPDKKRTDNWLSLNRLQLPLSVTNYGSIKSITYPEWDVNTYSMQKNENFSMESVKGDKNNGQVRENLLSGDSERGRNESSGKQAEKLSKFKQEVKGKEEAERKSYTKELRKQGLTEEKVSVIEIDGERVAHKYNLIKPENYNDDMKAIVKEEEAKGKTVGFFAGYAIRQFDGQRDFLIDGIKISDTEILLQYDGVRPPQQLFKHEDVHTDWDSDEVQAAKDEILNDLTDAEKDNILSEERYENYMELYDGDMDAVWEEFIADTMAGMNDYTERYIDIVDSYWHSEEGIDIYTPAEYTNSIDAGGKYSVDDSKIPYNEKKQLQEYIMQKNNSGEKLKAIDYKEVGNHFYIWENSNKTDYDVMEMMPIEGNEDLIDNVKEAIDNETYGRTGDFNTRAERIRSGKRSNSNDNGGTKRTEKNGRNDRFSSGQSESDTGRYTLEVRGDSQTKRKPKYSVASKKVTKTPEQIYRMQNRDIIQFIRDEYDKSEKFMPRIEDVKKSANKLGKGYTGDKNLAYEFGKLYKEVKAAIAYGERADATEREIKRKWDEVQNKIDDIAMDIVMNNEVKNDENWQMIKDFRRYLHGRTIKVPTEWHADFDAQGGIDGFRKHNRGRFFVSYTKGESIETLYPEMRGMFGNLLPDISNPADQLIAISDFLDEMAVTFENPYDSDIEAAAESMSLEIMADMLVNIREVGDDVRSKRIEKLHRVLQEERLKRYHALNRVKERQERKIREATEKRKASAEKKADMAARQRLLAVAKKLESLAKKSDAEKQAEIQKLIGHLDLAAVSITGQKLGELNMIKEFYDKMKLNPDFIPDKRIEEKLLRLDKQRIADMKLEDVIELTNLLIAIEHKIRTDAFAIDIEDKRNLRIQAEETLRNIENSSGSKASGIGHSVDTIITNTLTPTRELRRMTGYVDDDPLYLRTKELQSGQVDKFDYAMKAEKMFEKYTNDKKFMESITGAKAKTYTYTIKEKNKEGKVLGDRTITITAGMRISLLLHNQNSDNQKHMKEGGVKLPDIELYKAGEIEEAYARGEKIYLHKTDIEEITKNITEEEREYARQVWRYFNNFSKNEINRVSVKLKGYELAKVKDYYPIEVSEDFMKQNFELVQKDGTIEGIGNLKERTGSNEPIYLRDVASVLDQGIRMHSSYVGLAIPVRNMTVLMSKNFSKYGEASEEQRLVFGKDYTLLEGYYSSIMETIGKKWGVNGQDYIEKMMQDIQGGKEEKRQNDITKKIKWVTNRFIKATLNWNLKVAFNQVASIPAAIPEVGFKAVARSLFDFGRVNTDLIAEYTPLQYMRGKGATNVTIADMTKSNNSVISKIDNVIDKVDLMTWTDNLMTRKLWKAAIYNIKYTRKDLKTGTREFYEAVADVYTDIMQNTQPNVSMMERPQFLRADETTKMVMTFQGEPLKNVNLLYESAGNLRAKARQLKQIQNNENSTKEEIEKAENRLKQAKSQFGVTVISQILSSLVFAVEKSIFQLLYGKVDDYWDDEEEKVTFCSWLVGTLKDTGINFFTQIPFAAHIVDFVSAMIFKDEQYYPYTPLAFSSLEDLESEVLSFKSSATDLFTGKGISGKEFGFAAYEVIEKASNFLGIPTKNVVNFAKSVIKLVEKNVSSNKYVGDYAVLKYEEALTRKKLIDGEVEIKATNSAYDILYRAMRDGDKEGYDIIFKDLVDRGVSYTDIESAMQNRAKKDENFNLDTSLNMYAGVEERRETEKYEKYIDSAEELGIDEELLKKVVDAANSKKKYKERKTDAEKIINGASLDFESEEFLKGVISDSYSVNDLSKEQYIEYSKTRATYLQKMDNEIDSEGMSEREFRKVYNKASDLAEEYAFSQASDGEYSMRAKWMYYAVDAEEEVGMTTGEFLKVYEEYGSTIYSTPSLITHEVGYDVSDYLEFHKLTKDIKGDKDENGKDIEGRTKQDKIIEVISGMNVSDEMKAFLFSTEYKSEKNNPWKSHLKVNYKEYIDEE